MTIVITSKLTSNQSQRLRRAASANDIASDPHYRAFVRAGTRRYAPLHAAQGRETERDHAHNVARHMMTVVGTTFEYRIV